MREHILNVAEELFYREGTRAVGIDRIIAEAGIAKATLYSKFASKSELVAAYLRGRSARILRNVRDRLDQFEGTPRERTLFLFDELARTAAPGGTFRGCAFMLAVAENGEDAQVREIAIAHKAGFEAIFAGILAGEVDDFPNKARQVALCYEGALTIIAINGGNHAVKVAKTCVEQILASR